MRLSSRLLSRGGGGGASAAAAFHASPPLRRPAVAVPAARLAALARVLREQAAAAAGGGGAAATATPRASIEAMAVPPAATAAAAGGEVEEEARALWDAVSPLYYRPTAATVVAYDWPAAMAAIAAALPHEGVTERALLRLVRDGAKGQPLASLATSGPALAAALGHGGVPSLAVWVRAHFAAGLLVARSAATGEALYYRRIDNSMLLRTVPPPTSASTGGQSSGSSNPYPPPSREQQRDVAALQHALRLLGLGKQLPVWVDFAKVAPLLPTEVLPPPLPSSSDGSGGWAAFLARPHIRSLFEVEADVLVRCDGPPTGALVIVDGTSVSAAEVAAWMGKRSAASGGEAAADIRVLVRGGGDGGDGGDGDGLGTVLRGAERVVVERLLDPEHVIGALIEGIVVPPPSPPAETTKRANNDDDDDDDGSGGSDAGEGEEADANASASVGNGAGAVHVFCGDGSAEAIRGALQDLRRPVGVALHVHTPTTEATV